jgi:hypothetical protein
VKVRDKHATINGTADDVTNFPNGIEIVTDDGRSLFDISLNEDGTLEIFGGTHCKFNNKILTDNFTIQPLAFNCVRLIKNEHKP